MFWQFGQKLTSHLIFHVVLSIVKLLYMVVNSFLKLIELICLLFLFLFVFVEGEMRFNRS